jgi:dTDP-4-dehydrorhamnose reductase
MKNVLILGAKGMLGGQLMKRFADPLGWDRQDVDVLDFEALKKKILALPFTPEAIINCVAYNDVDKAEDDQKTAFALNAEFVGKLAEFTKQLDIPLVHFSSNYVFDGQKGEYLESDTPNPLSVYGQSKYGGEKMLAQNADKFYLIRTAVLFGPKGESEASKKSFVDLMLQLSETPHQSSPGSFGTGQKNVNIKAVNDEINSLTLVTDLADAVKFIVEEKKPYGIYHITNSGSASWYDFAKEIFAAMQKNINLIPVSSSEFPRQAKRPKKAVLLNTKLYKLQPWPDALREYLVKEYLTK